MDNGQNKKNGMMFNNINSWSIDGSNGLPLENVRRKERKCPCFGHDYALRENKATDRGKACSARRLLLIIAAATLLVGIAVAIAVVVTVVLKENPAPEPKPVGGEAKLQISLNKTFIDELQQKDSPEFKDLESKFCASMENIYKSDQSEVKSMPLTCRVDSFSSGSIIVTFLIRVTGDVTGITAETFSRTIFNKFGTETGVEGDLAFILDTVVVVNYSHIMTTTTTLGTTTTTTQTTNPNVTTSPTSIHNTSDTTITFTTAVTDVASTTDKTIPTTSTTSITSTTSSPPVVTCSGVNGLIGSSATVECHVNNSTYSYINVTFTPSKTQTSNHFVDIDRISGVVNDDSGAERTVTVSNGGKYIRIDFTSLSCSDSGTFHLSVFAVSGDSSTTASVSVRDPPTTNPTLTPATRIATGHLLSPAIKCSGEVGYPSGALNLQIKKDGSSSFVNVTEFTKSETSTDGDCAVTLEASYTGTPTTSVNGSYIRCATFHQDAVGPLYSSEEFVLVIDGIMCDGKKDNDMLYHPYDCGKFITCATNLIHVTACGPGAPCVRINETTASGYCDSTCSHCPSYQTIIPNSRK